jgi:hypothetical protein
MPAQKSSPHIQGPRTSRRKFLMATATSAALPAFARALTPDQARAQPSRRPDGPVTMSLNINGKEHQVALGATLRFDVDQHGAGFVAPADQLEEQMRRVGSSGR